MGHNMFLDVCHIVNRFCQPLPDSYDEFKKTVHALFPRLEFVLRSRTRVQVCSISSIFLSLQSRRHEIYVQCGSFHLSNKVQCYRTFDGNVEEISVQFYRNWCVLFRNEYSCLVVENKLIRSMCVWNVEPSNPEFAYSTDQKKEHEAGFDAYLTGLIFISLGSYLLPSGRSSCKRVSQNNLSNMN